MTMLAHEENSPIFSKISSAFTPPALRVVTVKVLAADGINLGQGTCQVPPPPEVLEGATKAIQSGFNGYTVPRGLPALRTEIARKLERHNHIPNVNPGTELLITCGATGALEGICTALLDPGDEVILFEPYYPYHRKTVERFEGVIKYVPLRGPALMWDPKDLRKAFSAKTKFVLVNTPGNPTGKVFTREELLEIGRQCIEFGAYLVSDEIYEYMVFDGGRHIAPASIAELRPITLMIGGYSKTYAITGWRIGFLLTPDYISEKICHALDLAYVCAPGPLQHGVAHAIASLPDSFYEEVSASYQRKRDMFSDILRECGFNVSSPQGAYYLIGDYSARFPDLQGMDFVDHMIARTKVGAVPPHDFVRDHTSQRWVRFCVALEDHVLQQAGEWLKNL